MKLEGSCPNCKGDIHGTPRKGYYCPRCNMLFRRHTLALRHIRQDLRKLINEHFATFERQLDETRAGIAESAEEGLHDLSELQGAVTDLASLLDRDLDADEQAFEEWKASRWAAQSGSAKGSSHRVVGKKTQPKKSTKRKAHKTTKRKTVKRAKSHGMASHAKKRATKRSRKKRL